MSFADYLETHMHAFVPGYKFGLLLCQTDLLTITLLAHAVGYSQQRKGWMDNIKERTSLPMPGLLKIGRGSLLSHPFCSHDDPVGQWTELK